MPTQLLRSISFQLREAEHAHALVIERVRLGQVQNVELDFKFVTSVAHAEEEPLCVSISVDIILKNEIIFVVAHFHRRKQVSCFESGFKDERLI